MEGGSCICARHVNIEKAELSLGTLGGGNPFLEPDQDENGNLYAANTFRESETGKRSDGVLSDGRAEGIKEKRSLWTRIKRKLDKKYLSGKFVLPYDH